MKICTCGHEFTENEKFCPICGNKVEDIPESANISAQPLGAISVSAPVEPAIQNKESSPEPKKKQEDEVSPISAIFEKTEPSPQVKRTVVKPEVPKPGPNVEIKPIANPSQGQKLNPLKNPPPIESKFSVLSPLSTTINVFVMLIPFIGFVYSFILVLGAAKKENTRVLATSFLTAYLIQIVLVAIVFLVMSIFFEVQFNQLCGIIKYMIDTFIRLIK